MEHFFDKNSYKICLRSIFSKACSANASKMHKIGYMSPPRGSPDASRTAQDGFCLRFGCQLEAKLAPCWPLFPLKTVPWRLQDDPGCSPESFWSPKMAREASKSAPEPSKPRFWTIFHRFLVHFWLIFGWFLVHFSSIFHSISRFKKQAFQHQKNKKAKQQKSKARWRVRSSAARWIIKM